MTALKWGLRAGTDNDYEFCKHIGHQGIKPYISAYRPWDQAREDQGFQSIWQLPLISIIFVERFPEANRACSNSTLDSESTVVDIGFRIVNEDDDEIRLDGIYLAQHWRGKGIGTLVLRSLLEQATKPVRLRVFKNNPARRLYRRLGFRVDLNEDPQPDRWSMIYTNDL